MSHHVRGPVVRLEAMPDEVHLVEAAWEYVGAGFDVARDGDVRPHRRVAVSVLATVARQLERAAEEAIVHGDDFAALRVRDNAILATLAAGVDESDPRFGEVSAAMVAWAHQRVQRVRRETPAPV